MGNKQSHNQNGISRSPSGTPHNSTNRSSNTSPQSVSSNSISSPMNQPASSSSNRNQSQTQTQNADVLPQNRMVPRSRNANSESDQLAHQLLNLIMNRQGGSSSSVNNHTSSNSRSRSFRLANSTSNNSSSQNQAQNLNNSDQLNPFTILSNLLAADPDSSTTSSSSHNRRSHMNFDEAMRQRLIYHNARLFNLNRGEPKKCEYCGKMVNPMREDPEIHMVKCMTKPRIKHTVFELKEPEKIEEKLGEGDNNTIENKDNSRLIDEECTICFDEYKIGDKLARLECFCVFHKSCLDNWLSRKQCCPLHSHFEDDE